MFLAFLMLGGYVTANPKIDVEFPNPIPNTLSALPVKISISDPQQFGYPRVPTTVRVSLVGYRNHGIEINLQHVNFNDPQSLHRFLHSPIEVTTELPLPKLKIGWYRLVVDVKCLYGPHYYTNYWYSFTENKPLEVVRERVRIVSGPEIEKAGYAKFYGYSFSQAIIYDWQKKGISFRFKVQILDSQRKILYEEPGATIGTVFSLDDLTPQYIQEEKKELNSKYSFLLKQFPNSYLDINYEIVNTGDWRWLLVISHPNGWLNMAW